MCGLTGLLLGDLRRTVAEDARMTKTFTRLLVASEHRGPYATGAARLLADGTVTLVKAPQPATAFVASDAYCRWAVTPCHTTDLPHTCPTLSETTCLIGHTRWPSCGSVTRDAENHPLDMATPILLTHNGTLADHHAHAKRLHVPLATAVDSEVIARLAQRHLVVGCLGVEATLEDLTTLTGSLSAVLVATTRPTEILLVKGNMPLCLTVHAERRLLAYASEVGVLRTALAGEDGWEPLPMAPGTALLVDTAAWDYTSYDFGFEGGMGRRTVTGQ